MSDREDPPKGPARWVGDEVTPLVETATGAPLLGFRADGSLFSYGPGGRIAQTHRFTDPLNLGNAWMAIDDGAGVVRYLSDQWDGRICGFEKRVIAPHGDVHVAQTHATAIGILAFGGGSMMVRRGLANAYGWHHLFADYSPADAELGADAAAQAFLRIEDSRRHGLPTVLTANLLFGSGLYRDTFDGSARLGDLARTAARMAAQARTLGKDLWIDRILLSLYEAKTDTTLGAASYEYGMAMRRLRAAVVAATGQPAAPVCIVSQSAGTVEDGTSPVILAEAQLDIDHWALGAVVATPKYHLPVQPGTRATLTPAAARYVSEIEAVAADVVLNAGQWYCPRLTHALLRGCEITAHFMGVNGESLVLDDPARHGFTLAGETGGAAIANIRLDGLNAMITLDAPPAGEIALNYAFGAEGDRGDGFPANRGTLRDGWGQVAMHDPGVMLRRHALSASVPVRRAA